MLRTVLWSALGVLVASLDCERTALAQDPSPAEVQEIATADGFEKFRVPADWKVNGPRSTASGEIWNFALPDDLGTANLLLTGRGEARDDGVGTAALAWRVKGATYSSKPIPVAFIPLSSTDGKEWAGFESVRVAKRRGFLIRLEFLKPAAERLRPAFVAIVQSFETMRQEAPDAPDTYKRVIRDGYLYLLEPSVAESEIAPVHRLLAGVASSLVKRYGPLPKSQSRAIVVVIVPDLAHAADFCPRVKADGGLVDADVSEAVLYATPLPKGDQHVAGTVAEHCAFLLLSQYFGLYSEDWLLSGEALLAASEGCTGKPPPVLFEGFLLGLPKSLPELRELSQRERLDHTLATASLVYVAFLRSAGKPYSDAFSAYIKELRAGTAPGVAADKTILTLDQGKLRSAAEAYMATLKAPKAK